MLQNRQNLKIYERGQLANAKPPVYYKGDTEIPLYG